MNSNLYNHYRLEIRLLTSLIIILNIVFLFNFFSIQILEHNRYTEILIEETVQIIKEKGPRGKIMDTNNSILAENIEKFEFWVNTTEEFDKESIVSIFSKTFNKNKEYYESLLDDYNYYIVIEKNIEELNCQNILSSINQIKGLRYNSSIKRFYPYDNLVSNLIGFLGADGQYSSGIEYYFNDMLLGEEFNVEHRRLDNGKIEYNNTIIPSGKDIGLTIDLEIQSILRNELKKGVEESQAISGNGIIVNPYTGAILAMASFPDFNANRYNEFDSEYYKNRTISENYEPGSTFKIVALVAALENDIVSLKDSIDCEEGSFTLKNGHILHDHEPYGKIPISDVFAFSSNIGMAKIADLLDNRDLYNKSREFGFGVNTGILLPNEQSGSLYPVEDWSYQSNKSLAIGQEISCTSLQLSMAYSAIANGGYLLQPNIIRYIGDNNISKKNPKVIRKVMDLATSKIMISLLSNVVSYGSGSNAYIKGYNVAGKTGTAEKFVNDEYSKSQYISSFVSIFPANNPQYVCVISIDSPNKILGKHWGNETAAPITKEIYKKIINTKNIKPETFIANQDIKIKDSYLYDNDLDLSVVPNFKGQTLKQALEIGKKIGLTIKPVGHSGQVVWQSAKVGTEIDNIKICELKVE